MRAAVVLAMPDPQARRLLGQEHPLAARLDREFEPVLALAARWPQRTWDDVSPTGRFDGAFVNDDPVLSWVADDGRRRGDDAPVLVAHSTPEFAGRHLVEPAGAGPEMVRALRSVMDLPDPRTSMCTAGPSPVPWVEREEPFLRWSTVRAGSSLRAATGGGPRPRSRPRGARAVTWDEALVQRLA